MHDVWAFRLEYRPAGQLIQTILELPYFPAGQDPQELAPSPLIFPAGQYSHWLVLDEISQLGSYRTWWIPRRRL